MNELRDWLKDADPVVNEPPLSDADVQRMRRPSLPRRRVATVVVRGVGARLVGGGNRGDRADDCRWHEPLDAAGRGQVHGVTLLTRRRRNAPETVTRGRCS